MKGVVLRYIIQENFVEGDLILHVKVYVEKVLSIHLWLQRRLYKV